jgi:hypothetical protein
MPVIFNHETFALASPEFHWPKTDESEAYSSPMERAGGLLVRELARVGWDAPGIKVEIDTYGRGEDLIRCVRGISGVTAEGPFQLKFNGPQGRKGAFNVCTGLSSATIPPGVEITFYGDRSGPTAHLYFGKNWGADGEKWISDSKVNSKLNGEPKTYLRYSGWSGSGWMRHDDDIGREYSPTSGEPARLDSTEVAGQVVKFIDGLIVELAKLPTAPGFEAVTPQGDANLRRLARVERIPAPDDFPLLYAWIDSNDAYRLRNLERGDAESGQIYGVSGSGSRLCSLGAGVPDLPPRATDGFTYASVDPTVVASHVIHSVRDDSSPAIVKLKWLNDVFVVDNAAYERAREEVFAKIKAEAREGGRMTNAELDWCAAATAKTLVPVTEYKGGFEQPIYLIGRQTAVDEVRMVKGSIVVSQTENTTNVVLWDDETKNEFEVFSRESIGERAAASARRVAERYGRLHSPNGGYSDLIPKRPQLTEASDEAGLQGLRP